MKQPCGCCAGIEVVTPVPEANRPGLPALTYRVGTYATFLESMVARLSTLYLDVPVSPGSATLQRIYPLKNLTTREPTDPSVALLDAWATVADVLTFYQERIANEGYLGTATERRSVLELARLIGYELRPGVSASVYLAFTVADGFNGTIPSGTRAQSIPGPGQTPQFFETSDDLPARDVWNSLQPLLVRPQVITLNNDPGTHAATRETVYFQGISTSLNPGDALLFVLGNGDQQQVLRRVASVDAQANQQRTEVTLLQPPPQVDKASVRATVTTALQPFIGEASDIFSGSDTANQVAATLQTVVDQLQSSTTATKAVEMIESILPQLEETHDLALKRKFTRLEPWIANILDTLNSLVEELPQSFKSAVTASSKVTEEFVAVVSAAPLTGLTGILSQLTLPPSLQPASSVKLARSVNTAFASHSDIAPRMLASFNPAAASTLYEAWAGIDTPQLTPQVDALRVKAGLFPGTYPGPPTVTSTPPTNHGSATTITTSYDDSPSIDTAWPGLTSGLNPLPTIPLDTVYDKIVVGSWVVIERPVLDQNLNVTSYTKTFHRVTATQTVSMATFAYTARVTQLALDPAWLSDLVNSSDPASSQGQLRNDLYTPAFLRGTVVYAQSEELDLADEPLDTDVEGDTLELAQLYDGLDSGRWIIVSGERTDIPNVSGVTASELVMISAVAQGYNVSSSEQPDSSSPLHTILTLPNKLAYKYDSNTVTIYGNVVNATNGQTQGEVLGDGDASQSGQQFALHQSPLTYLSGPTPAGAQSTLTVRVNEVQWNEAHNLLALGSTDRGFITQTDDNDQTTVIFGTGGHGTRVPTGTANVKAVYRYGIGQVGNVAAQQISQLATQPLGAKSVINPLPATGGADRDTRDQARLNAPLAVMALDRLVSVEDYADFARTYAGIGKAASARLTDGRRLIVHVTIAGKDDIPIDQNSDLYRNLVLALQQSGDPHQPLQVALRRLKLLVISAGVKVQSGYAWEAVAPILRSALLDFYGFEQRDLGQSAFLSEAISVMQGVAGVQYVDVHVFDFVAESMTAAQLAALASSLTLNDVVESELAQVDPTATDPSQRILPAELAILTPDIPDTLILTEITV